MNRKTLHPATLAAQALGSTDASTGAVVLPIHTATTFLRDPDNQYRRGRGYGRADNPSYDQPQALLTALEGGAATLLFSSGMAAATAVFQCLAREAHVVAPRVMYWGLRSWLKNFAEAWGIAVDFVDATSLDALRLAVRPDRTRLIWIESPANPLWSVTDIAGCSRHRPQRRRAARRRQHRRNPGVDPAIGARGRSRHAFGDQIPERPQRCDRRDLDDGTRGRVLARGCVRHAAAAAQFSAASKPISCCAACALCSRESSAPAARPSK